MHDIIVIAILRAAIIFRGLPAIDDYKLFVKSSQAIQTAIDHPHAVSQAMMTTVVAAVVVDGVNYDLSLSELMIASNGLPGTPQARIRR